MHITPILFICLNLQLSYSQDTLVTTQWPDIMRTSDFQASTFRGRDCDDTEYRDYSGSPAWKNYGGWLSECDSLSDTYYDSLWAIDDFKRKKKNVEDERKRQEEIDNIDLDVELDMDAMWDNTVWNEIADIVDTEVYEVEQITAVAGVRGAEAEDEALHHLYYRRSMRGLSELDLKRALGKLMIKREKMPDDSDTKKIDNYIIQLKLKIAKV